MLNIFIVMKLFLKYILVPVINVILSLCVLAGGFAFIIFTFGGWLPETCSVDGIRCYSLMLSMAFGSIVLVLGVLTRILIHLSSELHEYKKAIPRHSVWVRENSVFHLSNWFFKRNLFIISNQFNETEALFDLKINSLCGDILSIRNNDITVYWDFKRCCL
ncbi:hypothetical protein [Photobacterium sp. TY1-4]|uniref:hypothetical protein n=1 Tax=Photobacterium sp. TY1-4 TaxID=2899122 RepID=UPI0021C092A2|nr:hypothetical protein [Photobacterium sp. TY1-4]UXI03049.1 hypothetical protein NH461_21645 [Photobacterium sp. TY1-4]